MTRGLSRAIIKPVCWYSWHDETPIRLRQECEAMNSRFPQFSLVRGDDGKLGWTGELTSNRDNRYKILIDYPANFPHKEPAVYILRPRLVSQHMWKDGHICLMYPDDSTWLPNTTCATIAAIAAAWIFCYENHKAKCHRDEGGPCMDPQCPDWPGKKI